MATRIQIRRGTAAEWASANPILAQGELGAELDTDSIKVGDGTSDWNSLGYVTGGAGPYMLPLTSSTIICCSFLYLRLKALTSWKVAR